MMDCFRAAGADSVHALKRHTLYTDFSQHARKNLSSILKNHRTNMIWISFPPFLFSHGSPHSPAIKDHTKDL